MSDFSEKILKFFNKGSEQSDVNAASVDEMQIENLEDMIDTSWAGYYSK